MMLDSLYLKRFCFTFSLVPTGVYVVVGLRMLIWLTLGHVTTAHFATELTGRLNYISDILLLVAVRYREWKSNDAHAFPPNHTHYVFQVLRSSAHLHMARVLHLSSGFRDRTPVGDCPSVWRDQHRQRGASGKANCMSHISEHSIISTLFQTILELSFICFHLLCGWVVVSALREMKASGPPREDLSTQELGLDEIPDGIEAPPQLPVLMPPPPPPYSNPG